MPATNCKLSNNFYLCTTFLYHIMKFIISSSALLKQISTINGVIAPNPVVPILENFLFEIKDGLLKATASDLQSSMTTEIDLEAKEPGSIAIPAKILLETLQNLPEQPVTFTINEETYGIELSSDNGRYKLSGENATDFPKLPEFSEGGSVNIPSDILSKAISTTIIAASNDEMRLAMSGILVQLSKKNMTFVATDSHRMARYRRSDITAKNDATILIPNKALALLKNSLPSETTEVKFEFDSTNAFFSFDRVKMVCRLLDERFPDYENAIPTDNPNKLIINRTELLNSLKRIAIYSNKATYQVKFKIAGSEIQISAEDLDFSNEADERLTCEYEGEDIEIGFNARFLIEMLSNLDSEMIKIAMSEANKAGLIFPEEKDEKEDVLMLVMPVMLHATTV